MTAVRAVGYLRPYLSEEEEGEEEEGEEEEGSGIKEEQHEADEEEDALPPGKYCDIDDDTKPPSCSYNLADVGISTLYGPIGTLSYSLYHPRAKQSVAPLRVGTPRDPSIICVVPQNC